jgi:hypothetical protein
MDKKTILQDVRNEYSAAHQCFLAAQTELRASPADILLNVRYQKMLREVSTVSARLALLEVDALRGAIILSPRAVGLLIRSDDVGQEPMRVENTDGNTDETSQPGGFRRDTTAPFDAQYASQLSAAIVCALGEAKILKDAGGHDGDFSAAVTYARDLHNILLAQMQAAIPGSVEQLRRLCETMQINLAQLDEVRDERVLRAIH